jgi:DNA-binding ferritin-like protein
MNDISTVLIELSDLANALSGDFHTMHLNIKGPEFDRMHKKVLKKYYEQTADDYDTLAEMARRKPWAAQIPTTNESSKRIGWSNAEGFFTRESAVKRTDEILELYIGEMNKVYKYMDSKKECPVSQGIASWLQDRLNYWGSEWGFFNASRMEVSE